MSNFQEGSSRLNFPSGADFTNSGATYDAPYTAVKLSTVSNVVSVVAATANSDPILGILYNCPDASGTADVLSINQQGTAKVTAGGTISLNNLLTINSSGKAVAATQTTAGSQPAVQLIGRAMEAAVSGQVFCIQTLNYLY